MCLCLMKFFAQTNFSLITFHSYYKKSKKKRKKNNKMIVNWIFFNKSIEKPFDSFSVGANGKVNGNAETNTLQQNGNPPTQIPKSSSG